MLFDIPTTTFRNLAAEIADLYNRINNCNDYTITSVEINCLLFDHSDGRGFQLESRALIRVPQKDEYCFCVSVVGSPFEALGELKAQLFEKLKETLPEEFKKRQFGLN